MRLRSLSFMLAAGACLTVRVAAQDTLQQPQPAAQRKPKPPKSGGPYHITPDEVDFATGVTSAYEIVQRVRPSMLRKRQGARTENGPSADVEVYVDGRHVGPLESLRDIDGKTVYEIEYLNSGDATLRFGTGNTEGAILVTTRGTKLPRR